ncbi:MAG: FecR family protein, partial [Zoogloeaceae bacterium]|nr:FecR family protein [Zoogloeaceae bacterium]
MMERTYWNWNVLARGLLGIFLACWLGVAAGAEVGKIVLAVGDARMDGKVLKEGDAIPEGAELSTGADGYLYLKTVDNGFLILRPGSVATVVAYHVDEADPKKSRFRFSLQQGVARSISGDAVGKARKNFRFNTPVAAIGVRGTDFSIYADAQETRVVVLSGGVVVSGFDASCQPQGGGPCEGAGSKELFAGTPGILQIQKGDVPQIVEDKALSPDFVVPPRHDEPAIFGLDGNKVDHKADKPQTVAVTDQESVNLDPLKQSQLQP